MDPDITIEVDEMARILKCGPRPVEDALRDGELPGVKFGHGWVVPRQAFYQRLNEIALERAAKLRQDKTQPEPVGNATKGVRGRVARDLAI